MNSQHTVRGKWSEVSVPHKGWSCTGIDDLGEPSQTCEMCESVEIRYVHYMEHPDYPSQLAVGCVCAEHMEDDYVAPKRREKSLRSLASRRKSWSSRKWKKSAKGNAYIRTEGFIVTLAKDAQEKWYIAVSKAGVNQPKYGRLKYSNIDDAKREALPALLWAKEHL